MVVRMTEPPNADAIRFWDILVGHWRDLGALCHGYGPALERTCSDTELHRLYVRLSSEMGQTPVCRSAQQGRFS